MENVTIQVVSDPEISLTAETNEVCLGGTVDLTASVSGGTGNCSIQWQRRPQGGTWSNTANGLTTINAGTGFLSSPGVFQYRALYDCNGDGCGEDVSNVINIEVFEDPEISIDADDVEICLGETVSLSAAVDGGIGNCDIQWQNRPQGGTWSNTANGQTTITAGTGFLSQAGVFQYRALYDCTGEGCGEDVSNVINIEVFEDPEITIEADDLEVCLGEIVDITPVSYTHLTLPTKRIV